MSNNAKVNVDFIAEYKGANNLKRAHSDIANLTGGLKKLAGAFGLAFAGREIINFGKASVQAFATNQKQVALLDNTLKNLGKSYASLTANKFIDNLALATGKTKEELIPAFQGLLIATGDVTTAQNELQIAMAVSAGTGKDLSVVQVALSKAYLGNYTGLTRLGAGLSKATLATKDMKIINAQLAATFNGDVAIAADTVQGKMDRLNVAMTEAKVTIGSGLVQALSELSGTGGFGGALKGIQDFATGISDAIIGMERLIKIVGFFVWNSKGTNPITQMNEFNAANAKADMLARQKYGGIYATQYQTQVAKKVAADKAVADKAALVAANKLTQAAKDKLALERASLSLKLSGSVADMQNIEIQAALQRGQSAEVNNVLLLQRALLNGNADQATILSQEVLKANGLVMNVDGVISSLKNAKDPFAGWPTASAAAMAQINAIQAALDALRNKTVTVTVNTIMTTTAGGSTVVTGTTNSSVASSSVASSSVGSNNGLATITGQTGNGPDARYDQTLIPVGTGQTGNGPDARYDQANPIVINITAPPNTTIDTTQAASTNGTAVTVNRTNPFGMYAV